MHDTRAAHGGGGRTVGRSCGGHDWGWGRRASKKRVEVLLPLQQFLAHFWRECVRKRQVHSSVPHPSRNGLCNGGTQRRCAAHRRRGGFVQRANAASNIVDHAARPTRAQRRRSQCRDLTA